METQCRHLLFDFKCLVHVTVKQSSIELLARHAATTDDTPLSSSIAAWGMFWVSEDGDDIHVSGWRHVVTVYITPIQSWLLLWMETCHWLLLHWHTRAGISRCSLHNNCTSSDFQLRTIPAVLAAPAPHPVSLSLPPQPPISMDSLCEQSIPSSVSIAALSLAFSRQECEFMPCLVHFVVLLVLVWYGSVSCFVICWVLYCLLQDWYGWYCVYSYL